MNEDTIDGLTSRSISCHPPIFFSPGIQQETLAFCSRFLPLTLAEENDTVRKQDQPHVFGSDHKLVACQQNFFFLSRAPTVEPIRQCT